MKNTTKVRVGGTLIAISVILLVGPAISDEILSSMDQLPMKGVYAQALFIGMVIGALAGVGSALFLSGFLPMFRNEKKREKHEKLEKAA